MKNICDWNNCFEEGSYKAPVEKDNSKKYRMLCLNHVREFNKNWNYFEGMDDDQIYEFLKSDMTWHKPTQSFNSSDNFFKILWNNALRDEINNTTNLAFQLEVNEEISSDETKEVGAGRRRPRRKIKIDVKPIVIKRPGLVRKPKPVGLVIK